MVPTPRIQPHILRDSSGVIGRYWYCMLRVQIRFTRVVLLQLLLRFVCVVSRVLKVPCTKIIMVQNVQQ